MTDLVALLNEALAQAGPYLEQWFLVFLRVGAAMAVLPALGDQTIPARFRLVVAILVTTVIFPAVTSQNFDAPLADALLVETVIGLFIGLMLRFFVFALLTSGSIIANATSLSQLFPQAGEPQPAMSTLLVMAGLALALQMGLHTQIVIYLIQSYESFPPATLPTPAALLDWVVRNADASMRLALMLSMPFLLASFIYNLALGVINRAMPQLMVSLIGAPALSLGGLALLFLVTPAAISVWTEALGQFLHSGTLGR